jgi:hypothetical protein
VFALYTVALGATLLCLGLLSPDGPGGPDRAARPLLSPSPLRTPTDRPTR